ncbi:hypothetical protein D3C75_594200 [compost metagenome]
MTVIDDVQLGVGNPPGQQAHVDQRDQRVIVAGQYQGRLADLVQPVDAGPAEAGEQLPVVTELARRAHLGRMAGGQRRVATERTPVDHGCNADYVGRLDVASRAGHHPQHFRLARHHHRTRRRGGQHEFLATLRIVIRELLGQGATPGHADDVDLPVVEIVEHARRELGQPRKTIRPVWRRRTADTGYVEGNDFQVRVQRGNEREHQLQVGADAVENQQGRQVRLAGAYRRAERLAIQIDGTEYEGLRHASGPVGRFLKFFLDPLVGAGLLANASGQSTSMLNDLSLSRASPLPQ